MQHLPQTVLNEVILLSQSVTHSLTHLLTQVCLWLECRDITNLQMVNRSLCSMISDSDPIWQNVCYNRYSKFNQSFYWLTNTLFSSLDITGHQAPPGMENMDETIGYKALFSTWCRWFHGYSIEEIGMCNRFWNRMEKWLKNNALHIYDTLRPPPSLQLIQDIEHRLNRKIPRLVKLLYRFHDGQNIHSDRIRLSHILPYEQQILETGTKVYADDHGRLLSQHEIRQSMHYGLFGGYMFYDEYISMKFLPLQFAHCLTDTFLVKKKSFFRRTYHPHDLQDEDGSRINVAEPSFIISGSFHEMAGMWNRLYLVSDSAPGISDGVYVNHSGYDSAIPMISPRRTACYNASSTGGVLFHWLHEYLHRLESGVYQVQPLVLTSPEKPLAKNATRMISLFPVQETSTKASPSPSNGWNPSLSDTCVTKSVTNGVEIVASPIFVPERSDGQGKLFYSYSIRMRLLNNHCSRPRGYQQCQLTTRHWRLHDTLNNSEEVEGDGVIGYFPVLSTKYSQDVSKDEWPFVYQSCTDAKNVPTYMGGHFNFQWLDFNPMEGDNVPVGSRSPTRSPPRPRNSANTTASSIPPEIMEFPAKIDDFSLIVPDFIY